MYWTSHVDVYPSTGKIESNIGRYEEASARRLGIITILE